MGNAESQPIRNVDKRTARRDNALQYNQAIWNYRAHVLGPLKPPELLPAELGPAHSDNGSASVRVCIRRRPIFPHEMKAGEFDVVSCDGRAIVVHDCRLRPDCRNLIINHTTFRFDRVFDESATSDMVYDAEVAPLVRQAASTTVPGTVLMYGQTGSGKTFTMTALQSRVAADLFSTLDASGSDVVSASYVEVGSSGVRDLLNGGATCQLLTDASGEVQPVPLVEVRVEGADGLKSLFDFGKGVRATAATGVHDASSRSHAIFRLNVQRAGASPGEVGSLTLVDLAGSEQRIDSDKHDAKRAKEGAAINASLLALKDSIVTLASGGKFRSVAGGRHPLTQLLRHSFEGEARTTVLVTVSPSSKDTEHSINTLRHACVMHGQKTDGAQPGVVGRDEGHVGAVYIRGGDVQTEHIGEIDVVAARKRLLQEEARRDATSGHGVFRQEFGELYPADVQRREREAAAAFRRLQKKAMTQLECSSSQQARALVDARDLAKQGLGLNAYQHARLSHRIHVKQQIASAAVQSMLRERKGTKANSLDADAQIDARGPQNSESAFRLDSESDEEFHDPCSKENLEQQELQTSARREHQMAHRHVTAQKLQWQGVLDAGDKAAEPLNRTKTPWDDVHDSVHSAVRSTADSGAPRFGRRSNTPPTAASVPLSDQPIETAGAARERMARERALAGGRRVLSHGSLSAQGNSSSELRRPPQKGRRGPPLAPQDSSEVTIEEEQDEPCKSAYEERKEMAAARRAAADRERKEAIMRRREERSCPVESAPLEVSTTGASFSIEPSTHAQRREAAEARRAAAERARREAIEARLRQGGHPGREWTEDDLLGPSAYEERRQAALARKAKAEAARVEAINAKASRSALGLASVATSPGWSEEDILAPSATAERHEAAAARRALAEAARRQALLRKVGPIEGEKNPLGPSADHRSEAARLEAALAALPADASEATRMGLKKQLATHKAVLIREQRKKEQLEREARRAAEAERIRATELARARKEELLRSQNASEEQDQGSFLPVHDGGVQDLGGANGNSYY